MKMQSLLTIILVTVFVSSSSNGQTETDVQTPAVTYCTENQTEVQCKKMMRYDRRDKIESRVKRTSKFYCDDEMFTQKYCRLEIKDAQVSGCISTPYIRGLLFDGLPHQYDETPESQRNYAFVPLCSGHRVLTFCKCRP